MKELTKITELNIRKLNADKVYKTVFENEKFQRWFGDSKVKYKTGNPLICFHSTKFDFNTFHSLSHFGTKKAANQIYQKTVDSNQFRHNKISNQRTLPVFLRITKPAKLIDYEHFNHDLSTEFLVPMIINKHITNNHLYLYFQSLALLLGMKIPLDKVKRTFQGFLDRNNLTLGETPENIEYNFSNMLKKKSSETTLNNPRVKAFFVNYVRKQLGYDGFYYVNSYEDKGSISWIITSPGQVLPVFRAYRFAKENI